MTIALPRSEVKQDQTWNAESVFPSPEEFDAEIQSIIEYLPAIKAFQGHLGDSPDAFIEAMNAMDVLAQRAARVQVYATMSSAVDATNQQAAAMNGKANSALAQVSAATSFVDPELLNIGESKLRGWIQDDPRMKLYEHYFNDLLRKQAHVRNAEVEELLGMLRDPFISTRNTTNMLANADFKFQPIPVETPVTTTLCIIPSFSKFLCVVQPERRKLVWARFSPLAPFDGVPELQDVVEQRNRSPH